MLNDNGITYAILLALFLKSTIRLPVLEDIPHIHEVFHSSFNSKIFSPCTKSLQYLFSQSHFKSDSRVQLACLYTSATVCQPQLHSKFQSTGTGIPTFLYSSHYLRKVMGVVTEELGAVVAANNYREGSSKSVYVYYLTQFLQLLGQVLLQP